MSGSSTVFGNEVNKNFSSNAVELMPVPPKYKIATNNTFIIETNNHYHDASPYSSTQQKHTMPEYPENATKKNVTHVSLSYFFFVFGIFQFLGSLFWPLLGSIQALQFRGDARNFKKGFRNFSHRLRWRFFDKFCVVQLVPKNVNLYN